MSTPETVLPTDVPVAEAAPADVAQAQATEPIVPTAEEVTPSADVANVQSNDTSAEPPVTVPETEVKSCEPSKIEEEKKEKKQTRKPFSELLNKIRKPSEKGSSAEKKVEHENPGATSHEEGAAAPSAVSPEAPGAEALPGPAEIVEPTPAIAHGTEETSRDFTTPRKERVNLFDKITAFVLKPKSPKPRKPEATLEEVASELPAESTAPQLPLEEPVATPDEANPVSTEPAAPAADLHASPESAAVPEVVATETTEAPKVDKNEPKSPKDLAKLARRFSGRLFGNEKKEKISKKPELTNEQIEETPETSPPEIPEASSDAAPQIHESAAESTTETPPLASEGAPVISAAA